MHKIWRWGRPFLLRFSKENKKCAHKYGAGTVAHAAHAQLAVGAKGEAFDDLTHARHVENEAAIERVETAQVPIVAQDGDDVAVGEKLNGHDGLDAGGEGEHVQECLRRAESCKNAKQNTKKKKKLR